MKRLSVRATGRGTGVGRALATAAVEFAATAGCRRIVLDTLPTLMAAISIYRSLGSEPIPPCWGRIISGVPDFGKRLGPGNQQVMR